MLGGTALEGLREFVTRLISTERRRTLKTR